MMKNKHIKTVAILLFTLQLTLSGFSQRAVNGNFIPVPPGTTPSGVINMAASLTPTPQQLAWQQLEFTAFAHFGINTFTDKEWGEGTESPELFNPTDFDARQWVKVFSDAGMKLLIIVAKHHDGFCYWPSKYTDHSVKSSPWRKGKGDMVKELTDACHEYGLKVGVYLSPWDRHEKTYGDSPAYNKYFTNQLKELLTNYGEITEVWFDGACAEGPNGKKQEYDWPLYYKTIRDLQPNALIFGQGPDIRWVGTETGIARETEWSVVPIKIKNNLRVSSSITLDDLFIPGDMTETDLGSATQIRGASALHWYPAEADVSIRPGWFYHQSQDAQVKTPFELVDLYFKSVGRNSVLLLNVPADKRGLLHENDISSLMGMRGLLNLIFEKNLAEQALFKYVDPSSEKPFYIGYNNDLTWEAKNSIDTCILQLSMSSPRTFDVIMLQEEISRGQKVENFRIEVLGGQKWNVVARGTTIGYKRLLTFPSVTGSEVRIILEKSRSAPTLKGIGLYKLPTELVGVLK